MRTQGGSVKQEQAEQFETPARIRPEHIVLNPEAEAGQQRYAVRDDSPLGIAFSRGKLGLGGRRGHTAIDRYRAGSIYQGVWETVNCARSPDGIVKERVNQSFSGTGGPEAKIAARDLLKKMEAKLSENCRFILRLFLGEGSSGSEAVKARCYGLQAATWLAICLYLDELIDAIVRIGVHNFQDVSQETIHAQKRDGDANLWG